MSVCPLLHAWEQKTPPSALRGSCGSQVTAATAWCEEQQGPHLLLVLDAVGGLLELPDFPDDVGDLSKEHMHVSSGTALLQPSHTKQEFCTKLFHSNYIYENKKLLLTYIKYRISL